MIISTQHSNGYLEARRELPYSEAHRMFKVIYPDCKHPMLMESKQVSLFSGRFSLIGINPALRLKGKHEVFSISVLDERGQEYLEILRPRIEGITDSISQNEKGLSGTISLSRESQEESKRSHSKNISFVLREALTCFASENNTLQGLYGAMSYDFVRLFENLYDSLPESDVEDFQFLLYDTFLFFDHIKEKTEIVVYRKTADELSKALVDVELLVHESHANPESYTIKNESFSLGQNDFEEMVRLAKEDITQGEYFQIVVSNILRADFEGSAFAFYLRYREANPSPYLFYYDFGDEQVVGASPEMMVRYEEGKVHLRPIAGTVRRGEDPFADHDQELRLLNDPKERAELDMLVDLGRNDLSRICKPGIEVSDYRFVEKYSRVMHTVAHLTGELKAGYTGLDALISCANAGTLTGAPKVAAMRRIEELEKERRGYYGGTLGQLSFSGDVDTCILIRTASIKKGQIRYQSGAGLVYDSDPAREYQETFKKAQAFLDTFSSSS